MDQQTQQSSNSIPVPDYSPSPLYGSTQRSLAGQPSRSMYNEYGNEREDIPSVLLAPIYELYTML